MPRTGFIPPDVARVFRPAGSLAAILAGLKTCATSRERGKLGYETGCRYFFSAASAVSAFKVICSQPLLVSVAGGFDRNRASDATDGHARNVAPYGRERHEY